MSAAVAAATAPRTTILVLHPASLDPQTYLYSLIERGGGPGSSHDISKLEQDPDRDIRTIDWTIDNKYYSAEVTIRCYAQEDFELDLAKDVEVVVYLFSGRLDSLPPALVRVMAVPRDIAIAVRISTEDIHDRPSDDEAEARPAVRSSSEVDTEDLEDLFDELGVEFLDDTGLGYQEEDEKPVPILEQVRQTLMTHMWPNMVRKPLSTSTRGIDEDFSSSPSPPPSSSFLPAFSPSSDKETDFPTSFDPSTDAGPSTRLPSSIRPEPGVDTSNPIEFPGIDELRSQVMLEDIERFGGFNRLDMLDQDDSDDWVQAEYSRLDDWLDEDEDKDGEQLDESAPSETDPSASADVHQESDERREGQQPLYNGDGGQFEDDFSDFASFQSALPATTSQQSPDVPLDPTPLLLHLQNVREELVGLDEDTRRKRAGQEVETLLMSLGLGGLDWDDDDLADLDEAASIRP